MGVEDIPKTEVKKKKKKSKSKVSEISEAVIENLNEKDSNVSESVSKENDNTLNIENCPKEKNTKVSSPNSNISSKKKKKKIFPPKKKFFPKKKKKKKKKK